MKPGRNPAAFNAAKFCAKSIAGLSVLVLSMPAGAGEWTITPSASLQQSVTDNVRSVADGEESDFITTATAGLAINGAGRRAQLNFNYSLSEDRFWDSRDLDGFRQSLLGVGKVEAVEDFVFIDTRASISQVTLARGGEIAATDRGVGKDQTTVANFSITPNMAYRYGNWAESDLRLTFNETRFLSPNVGAAADQPDGSRSVAILTLLRSGPRFTKLSWELSGSTTFTNNASDRDLIKLSGEYAWSRNFSLLGSVAREKIDNAGINENNSAEIYTSIGARITPGPRSSFRLEVSNRFNDTTFSGDASYKISPLTAITASYAVSVQTDRQALAANLDGLVLDAAGNLINPNTGQPGAPNKSPFNFIDQTTKQETFNIALNGTRGRNTFGIFSSLSVRTQLPGDVNDTVVSLGGNINRRIWPDLDGGVSANMSTTTQSANGIKDLTVNSSIFLNYRIQDDFSSSLRYNFLYRNSDNNAADLQENVITLNLSKTF